MAIIIVTCGQKARFSPESIGILAFLIAKPQQKETILATKARYACQLVEHVRLIKRRTPRQEASHLYKGL